MPTTTTTALTLHVHDGEPRVLDTDLAKALGMAEPTDIRATLLKRHEAELRTYGDLRQVVVKSGQRGRPATATYLNEQQALLVVMFSRTPKAAEVRREVIEVFTAWRRGELARPAPKALPQTYHPRRLRLHAPRSCGSPRSKRYTSFKYTA